MKRQGLFLGATVVAVALASLAQVSGEPATANSPEPAAAAKSQNPTPSTDTLAPGTLLAVELSKSLDARKTKINDRVEARTATDILAHGRIVVPRNTKIAGHVTEAKARSKDSPDSKLAITFDHLLLKGGREVPLQLAVQAIARPLQFASSVDRSVTPANREGRAPMPGQRPLGDASEANSNVPSSYPGDLAPIADPMAPSSLTVVPLDPASKGVVGMKGLALDTSGPVAVLTSNSGNVHLDSGTQLILRVQ
ncbi:MAG TPA: hypothetical protein VEU11_12265 [Terriglobales bacterium]|nr:hypothetical protein [Terriglobales bacterium]